MTEYWVSQTRYYCKFCKCWMTDKKLTREAHDKGTRHKQAVKEHFDKLKKDKFEQEKADNEVLAELRQIEKAANQQYAEDVTKGYAAQLPGVADQRQQYFFYGSGDEAFVSAQSEEKAKLEAFYQQHMQPAQAEAVAEGEEEIDAIAEGDEQLKELIAKKKEEKRKREEEEERKKAEEEKHTEERNKRGGPYGAWVTVDQSEIEEREEAQRSYKKQRTREIEQDSSDSDAEEEDDRMVKKEVDEPAVVVEFKKRPAAGGRRRPPPRKKLSDAEGDDEDD